MVFCKTGADELAQQIILYNMHAIKSYNHTCGIVTRELEWFQNHSTFFLDPWNGRGAMIIGMEWTEWPACHCLPGTRVELAQSQIGTKNSYFRSNQLRAVKALSSSPHTTCVLDLDDREGDGTMLTRQPLQATGACNHTHIIPLSALQKFPTV